MLSVNMDNVGKASIVECEGTITGDEDALQLRDAVTERATNRVIVIDLSRVSTAVGKGLSMLLFLQRWARHRSIQLKLFNPCPSLRRDLEHAISPYKPEFASLGEVMDLLTDAANRRTLVA